MYVSLCYATIYVLFMKKIDIKALKNRTSNFDLIIDRLVVKLLIISMLAIYVYISVPWAGHPRPGPAKNSAKKHSEDKLHSIEYIHPNTHTSLDFQNQISKKTKIQRNFWLNFGRAVIGLNTEYG